MHSQDFVDYVRGKKLLLQNMTLRGKSLRTADLLQMGMLFKFVLYTHFQANINNGKLAIRRSINYRKI